MQVSREVEEEHSSANISCLAPIVSPRHVSHHAHLDLLALGILQPEQDLSLSVIRRFFSFTSTAQPPPRLILLLIIRLAASDALVVCDALRSVALALGRAREPALETGPCAGRC